jgi:general secretion pathway protein G
MIRSLKINAKGRTRTRKGFTLIELMVVILILGILAALIVPKILNSQGKAKINAAKTDESSLDTALKSFHLDCDRYPSSSEGLNALRVAPAGLESKWHGPYLDKDVPNDPWGFAYVYQQPGPNGNSDSYSITSNGPTGQPGGTGDDAAIVDDNG